ncbi:MAG: hypothetical protein IPI10_14050 [Bacteroidetes bacterium]|nr:hypothetical protein [Bacteroidota bacterium]
MVFLHEMTLDKRDWEKFDFNEQNIIDFQSPQLTELMPSVIANDSPFCFPIRTVVNIDNDTDSTGVNGLSPLININIPFAFSIQNIREKLDKTYSHLKWRVTDPSKTDAKNRLQMFIEQLALMGRNKLIQEGVNPAKAGLVWFKPLSMGQSQTTIFNSIWKQVYEKYFL